MSNQLRDWLHSHSDSERILLADSARTSVAYLWQLAGGHRKASVELVARLNKASNRALTLEGLRPDLAELITPASPTRAA